MNLVKKTLILIITLLVLYKIPGIIKNYFPEEIIKTLYFEYTFYFMIILFVAFIFLLVKYFLSLEKKKILSNKEKLVIVLIIIFALLIRIGFSPMYDYARSSGWEYKLSSKSLLTENEFKICVVGTNQDCILEDEPEHNPGYPFFLAMIFSIFGLITKLPVYLNLFIGSLNAGLIYLIVKNLTKDDEPNKKLNKIGLFAAIIFSLMNAHIIYSGTGEVTVFMGFFISLSIYFATIPSEKRNILIDALTIVSVITCIAIQITNIALIFVSIIIGIPNLKKYQREWTERNLVWKRKILTYLSIVLISATSLIPFAHLFTINISTSAGTPLSTRFISDNLASFVSENLIIINPVVIVLFFAALVLVIISRIFFYKKANNTKNQTQKRQEGQKGQEEPEGEKINQWFGKGTNEISKDISKIYLTPLIVLMISYIGLYSLLFATHMERYTIDIYPAITIISAVTLGYILSLKIYNKKVGLLICLIILLSLIPTSRPLHLKYSEYSASTWADSNEISYLLKKVPSNYFLVTSTHAEAYRAKFESDMKISPLNLAFGGYSYLKDEHIAFINSGRRIENDHKEDAFIKRYNLKLVAVKDESKLYMSS